MEVVEKWPNADYYMPKLRRVRTHLMERGAATFQPDPSHFNTLVQGDLYVFSTLENQYALNINFHFSFSVG